MPLHPLPLAQAYLRYDPHWLGRGDADALFGALRRELEWEVHRIRLFGRTVDSPRLSCWTGDPDARYRYSGADFEPHPWPAVLLPIRDRLSGELGTGFNSVLANLYRSGTDAMGWHSDDERELDPQPVIASVSLGATRRFVLRHRTQPDRKLALELAPGSLLVMAGDTQRHYRHALPRTRRVVGERINLTFRCVSAPGAGGAKNAGE
ncbi:MAG: alpha-ketoglutarate-dependent dioxygenase AlkB [Pseudomonadota bacterium]|nr:alpha-ketoglutarate-dependent dioxygenase AlkB [Pseudomonadota bacterium]